MLFVFKKGQVRPFERSCVIGVKKGDVTVKSIQILIIKMSSFVKKLEASRRLEQNLDVERHRQQLQKEKFERELQGLRRSRKEYIEKTIQDDRKNVESKLREDPDLTEQFYQKQKRYEKERSKEAQQDFDKQRQRLVEERNQHDKLDKTYRELDKAILDLQARSKFAYAQEERRLKDLENRRSVVVKLLQESKKRELEHFDKGKAIAAAK